VTIKLAVKAQDLMSSVEVKIPGDVNVTVNYDGVMFSGKSEKFVPLKYSAVGNLKDGKSGDATKATYKTLFEMAIEECQQSEKHDYFDHKSVEKDFESFSSALLYSKHMSETVKDKSKKKKLKELVTAKEAGFDPFENEEEVDAGSHEIGFYDIDYIETGNRVNLSKAISILQPVHGTGGESRYFCAAISKDRTLKVAVRWVEKQISIRFAGSSINVGTFDVAMSEGGLKKTKKSHYSLHCAVDMENIVLARKIFGSVLMVPGIAWEKILTDIKVIRGKGIK